jgi:benzoate-CoA ligase family protein
MSETCNASSLLDRNVEAGRAEKIAVRALDAELTYAELRGQANRMGNLLRALGVRREQRVLLVLDDTTAFPIAFLGALRIGAVPVPVSVRDTPEHYRHFLTDSDAELIVCEESLLGSLKEALTGGAAHFLVRGAQGAGVTELDDALSAQEDELTPVSTNPDDMAFWLYSSGSTGMPKGVVHRHRSIEVTCETFAAQVLGLTAEDRIFSTTKLHHAYGLGNALSFPLFFGATAILRAGQPSPEAVLATLRERRPSVFCSVPALYTALVEDPDAAGCFDSVRLCVSAAEPLTAATSAAWRERFGIEILDGIGSTEMLQAYCSNRPGDVCEGTVGRPVPGYELRIADEHGVALEGSATGTLEVRGDSRALCYWRQPEQTSRRMRGDWWVSGDRFERREDGRYVYLGRDDDMLKVAGLWVSPVKMERHLRRHPAVADVGVVGATLEERPRIVAFVECADGASGGEALSEDLRAWCTEGLREHEFPHLIRYLPSLPRTPTGKPQRFKLRELIERSDGDRVASAHDDLTTGPKANRSAVLLRIVLEELTAILGGEPADGLDPRRDFKGLGLDSVGAMALRNRLGRAIGRSLPSSVVFDCPSPLELAGHLAGRLDDDSYAIATAVTGASSRGSSEPVAIVGMACRLPGGVSSAEDLWSLLARGGDAISRFPDDRGWDLDGLYDPDPDRAGSSYVREGGFVADATRFDPAFFGISPREALAMDPQQRLLLEGAWEALEDAGIDPLSLRGTPTGIYAGAMASDYALGARLPSALEGLRIAGAGGSALSGRIAYTLGLRGPAVSLDTACSSSLVALVSACQSLRSDVCSLAIVGGVTVLSTPGVFVTFSRQRGLSKDGRCRAFGEDADGTGFSEGMGVLVAERLSDARRNGHEVLALVRGGAVNQDGASNGFSAPSGSAQEQLIGQALADAGVAPGEVDAVEAHGTGTRLGDPIEAHALSGAYGSGRDVDRPLWLGSVKSNIGHTQAAAGVAGVIKMVMALRRGELPATLHAEEPSSRIDWDPAIQLLQEARPWLAQNRPRRAAVSSFGVSGTNAHVILEEAPTARTERGSGAALLGDEGLPWVLSGHSPRGLQGQGERLAGYLEEHPSVAALDVGAALAARGALTERAVVLSGVEGALAGRVNSIAAGGSMSGVVRGTADATDRGSVFLFPGQGSQWAGMAVGLLDTCPLFAERLHECGEALSEFVGWSLADVLRGGEDAPGLERVEVVQPALFAVMVSLAGLWEACGVRPAAVVGHSQGEIAAAHVAGGLSLQDAARVVALRARALARLAGRGGMVSVALGVDELRERLELLDGEVSVAAVNGPGSTVVSGENDVLAAFLAGCEADEIRARRIPVDYASHSAQIEEIREELLDACAQIQPRSGTVPFYSTLAGRVLDTRELDGEYWYRNLRRTVQFAPVIAGLLGEGYRSFVEVSPHPVLKVGVEETVERALAEPETAFIGGTLRRDTACGERFLISLARAWVRGATVDWSGIFRGTGARRVRLPTYAFQRERYWLEPPRAEADVSSAGQTSTGHPLLGAAIELPDERWLLTGRISLATHPWLADHAVKGVVLVPGTALLDLALQAGRHADCQHLEELTLHAPLVLAHAGAIQLQVSVSDPDAHGGRKLTIDARPEPSEHDLDTPGWTRHASGSLALHPQTHAGVDPSPAGEWPPPDARPIDVEELYDHLAQLGLEYGGAFRNLRRAWRDGPAILAEVAPGEAEHVDASRFVLHPALLDAALHPLAWAERAPDSEERPILLPFSWSGVEVSASSASHLRVRLEPAGANTVALEVSDATGAPVARVASLTLRAMGAGQLGGVAADSLFTVSWDTVATQPEGERAGATWTVLPGLDLATLAEAVDGGGAAPAIVIADFRVPPLDAEAPSRARKAVSESVRSNVYAALKLVRAWLADGRFAASRLVLLTRRAVAAGSEEGIIDLCAAPIWGLVRSAQQEHPERFVLIDVEGPVSWERVSGLLAHGESQLALRGGAVLVPRLKRARVPHPAGDTPLCAGGTVLITGAMGGLGRLLARHLVSERGVTRLVLAGRQGPAAPHAADLEAELRALGADVTILACDVADRDELETLISSLPADAPLAGVVHAAGVLDDAVIDSLTAEQVERVIAPKLDGAWNLHELTCHMDLELFVLFSSITATVGTPGQANYAAANAFLDALATHRRSQGLAGQAIAWGLWEQESEMTGGLADVDRARLGRSGIAAMSAAQGLELFDAAVTIQEPLVVAARLDASALRAEQRAGRVAPLLRGLVRAPRVAAGAERGLATRMAMLSGAERTRAMLDLVRRHAAEILGHGSAAVIPTGRPLKEAGMDSLTAVELRNALAAECELRLPSSLAFDFPSPLELADHLAGLLDGTDAVAGGVTVVSSRPSSEPVAIVGMACRFPGGVSSPEQLWELVASGADAISSFPDDRGWDLEGLFDPDPDHGGTSYAREGGFVHDATSFDPAFFGIGPREALAMDPQQRLLLEGAWEALEDAGIDPLSLRGTATGVFTGMMGSQYVSSLAGHTALEGYRGTGNAASVASGRVAYTLGLQGPALSVDTACSSSLVAIELANDALRAGRCALALASGVTVMANGETFIEFSRQRGLSTDGRCRAFAEDADGTGFSEGVGVLVLERLSDARRNGHEVLALIRGGAVNQDGASNGMTAPSRRAQEEVIAAALADAGVGAGEVDVVEGHGTGTRLGDPIEAHALLGVYGRERPEDRPLWLGSLKSNIGHTQAAAGVAGVIKMVMAVRHGVLPATLHAEQPSSRIDWDPAIRLLKEPQPWPADGRPRRAGVSSFGASGTNAHLILEEAPSLEPDADTAVRKPPSGVEAMLADTPPWLLSARDEQSLIAQAERLRGHVQANPDVSALDIAGSLAVRPMLERRAVVLGGSRDELASGLEALARGRSAPGLVRGVADADEGTPPRSVEALLDDGSRQQGGDRDERSLVSLAQAWSAGAPVDWRVLFADAGARRVALPTYAFQRQRYWLEPRGVATDAASSLRSRRRSISGAQAHTFMAQLRRLPDTERRRRILELVVAEAVIALGHPPGAALDVHRPFKDLGVDSLASVALRNALHAATGVTLAPTVAFEYPTAHELAEHLSEHLILTAVGDADASAPAGEASAEEDLDLAEIEESLREASDSELFAIVDGGLGA